MDGKVRFEVRHGNGDVPEGTVARTGARCVCCGASVPMAHVREKAQAGRMHSQMMAIVAESKNGRLYLNANEEHIEIAHVDKPENYPDGEIPINPRWFSPPIFGLENFSDIFTNRQLTSLTTFSSSIGEICNKVVADGSSEEYGKAVITYLALLIDKLSDYHSSICNWHNSGEKIGHTFGRQALPMTWDFAEANPFSNSTGCYDNMIKWIVDVVKNLHLRNEGVATQFDAMTNQGKKNVMISTIQHRPSGYGAICHWPRY